MDIGQFYSATIWTPQEMTLKGIAVRIGDKSEGAVLFDTELLRVVCGWSASDKFLEFNPARYGIIGPPKVGSTPAFHSPRKPGWARDGKFDDPRSKPFGPLPREWAKYRGLHRNGDRVVFEYTVGPKQVVVLESPWIETINGEKVFTRELEISASDADLELLVAAPGTPVKLVCEPNVATLDRQDGRAITAKVAKHEQPVTLKLFLPFSVNTVFQKNDLETKREDTENSLLRRFVKPGPARWTAEITTRGVVSDKGDALVVDTLTLPFDNPHKALMFVSGHDFFERGEGQGVRGEKADAAICTLHGDVWLVSGIDDKLDKLRWKRFATGLFQPLGLKIVKNQIYVVGRDQITRLHDFNGDGEADWYENFNNDAHVSSNGHEYVTCLETDRDGWFYFLKGNCDGKHDHDGCLLRVSPDGSKLEVVATGFRNANGLGVWSEPTDRGPREVFTVAPQEGEWTPGSAIFEVARGGFYGYVPSAHRAEPPKDFAPPMCWIPRLQDNSSGGQVCVPFANFGPWKQLAGVPIHFSYGTSRMFLVPQDRLFLNGHQTVQAGTCHLPLSFDSGVMRGRFCSEDDGLYVSGLRGWVSNAAQDGCFQRVRVNGNRFDLPVAFETYRNGILIRYSGRLDVEAAEDIDNYRVQRWNYRWSAAYGSPELKVSNPREEGRDEVEVLSATHVRKLKGGDAVFLELADMRPVNQLSIQMTLRNAIGQPIERRLDATIHATRSEEFPLERKPPRTRPGALTAEEQQRLVPGIRCDFVGHAGSLPERGQQAGSLLHVRRMAAWRFEPHELGNVREIVADGYLVAPRRGRYRISAECNSAVEISLGDQVVWRSTDDKPSEIELPRGHSRVKIVQRVAADQAVSLRLLWSGTDFETEPIPPTALFCEPLPDEVESTRLGRELFARHQCFRCHRVSADVLASRSVMPELRAEAPDLIGSGSRLRGEWIAQWVLNPQHLRSDARMPRLFPKKLTDEHRQQASDLAVYLSSLTETREPSANGRRQPPGTSDNTGSSTPTRGLTPSVRLGVTLWEDLGCIGCHQLTPQTDPLGNQRTSLYLVRDKFQPGKLIQFLQQPQRHFAWTRMPDFGLTEHEAESLALAITPSSDETPRNTAALPAGDAARGQKLFASLGCLQCHRVSRDEPLPQPHLASIFGKATTRGCLADGDRDSSAQSPDYDFAPAHRSALQAFLRGRDTSLATDTPDYVSRRFMAELRCTVCHPRDGRMSSLPEILAEEGESGRPPEALPNLTWTGEKLHAAWVQSILAGQIAERPRPWMKLRMPSFPARAKLLAEGLAREHGLSSNPSPRPSSDPELAEIGEVLATRTGTLDCRQCHSIGPLPPTGDKSTLLAPGINFALTRERIRHDFYRRFTLDPPRYDVTTRMPKLAADGRSTKVKDILDGNARQQFEAVWHFLQTVPSVTADP